MSTPRAIGRAIRDARERLQVSPQELAVSAHVDSAAIAAQEEEKAPLSIAQLGRVAAALGLDATALCQGRSVPQISPSAFFLRTGVADFFPDDREFLITSLEAAIALEELGAMLARPSRARAGFAPEIVGPVPFEDGYHLARRVRLALGNTVEEIGDLRRVLEERLDIAVCVAPFKTQRILGVTVKDSAHDAVAVTLNRHLQPRPLVVRVALAHELAHALFEVVNGPIGFVVDREEVDDARETSSEKRAKAFAAELLIPRLGLKHWYGEPRAVDRPRDAAQLIDDVRLRYLTPAELTVNHLWNHGYFCRDDTFRKELIDAASQRPSAVDQAASPPLPPADGRSSLLLVARAREAHDRMLITDGRARELLGLTAYDELPWELTKNAESPA